MPLQYEEILEGERCLRTVRDSRHEIICGRLHEWLTAVLSNLPSARLLPARTIVQVSSGTMFRPDIAIVAAATQKLWLAGEIICSHDHKTDTVRKKMIYEEVSLPRLWMIDPRYDNVEVYHGHAHGLALQKILAGKERLEERLLPNFNVSVHEIFAAVSPV